MTQKDRLKRTVDAYRRVVKSADGKIVMADLAKRCFVKSSTMAPDLHMVTFREGQRSVYLHMATMARIDLTKVLHRDDIGQP